MNSKELESLKKQSLHHVTLSPNTKTNIVSTDLMKLSANIKRQLASKRDVAVIVMEIKG
jgi:REP element-mobilizing transposase RayT